MNTFLGFILFRRSCISVKVGSTQFTCTALCSCTCPDSHFMLTIGFRNFRKILKNIDVWISRCFRADFFKSSNHWCFTLRCLYPYICAIVRGFFTIVSIVQTSRWFRLGLESDSQYSEFTQLLVRSCLVKNAHGRLARLES